MTNLITEQPIDNRQSSIENSQLAFSVALGYLQHLSQQAVDTLQSLMQDAQASPTVRLSAARTVLQMSFKRAELFTLQTRLDHLENAATALESQPQEELHQHPQSSIQYRHGQEEETGLNRSNPVKSIHLDQNRTCLPAVEELDEDSQEAAKTASSPLHSAHLPADVPPLPPSAARECRERGAGGEGRYWWRRRHTRLSLAGRKSHEENKVEPNPI